LRSARKKNKQTQAQIAALLKVSTPSITRWESGKEEPPLSAIIELAQEYSMSLDHLLTGQESPFQKAAPRPDITFAPIRLKNLKERPAMLRFRDAGNSYAAIPLLKDAVGNRAPAEVNEDDVESWAIIYNDLLWLPGGPENYTCVRVKGRSMYPILNDGDIVAIDHASRPNDLKELRELHDTIVAFRDIGGVTIKWLKLNEDKDTALGIPENKEDFDFVVILEGGQDIADNIVGQVRWWWSKR